MLYMSGRNLPIPDDLEIPTCDVCGEVYTSGESGFELCRSLEAANRVWLMDYTTRLLGKYEELGFGRRTIEIASGVKPNDLLKISKGKKNASETLLRLLETFLENPELIKKYSGKFERQYGLLAKR